MDKCVNYEETISSGEYLERIQCQQEHQNEQEYNYWNLSNQIQQFVDKYGYEELATIINMSI